MAAQVRPDRSAWTLPLHPIILTATLVAGSWLDTAVSPAGAVRAGVIGVLGAAILTLIVALVLRNRHPAAVVASGLIIGLCAKRLVYLVDDLSDRMPAWVFVVWVILIGLVVALVGRLLLRRVRTWTWPMVTARLNLAALLLLVATIGSGLASGRLVDVVTADGVGAVELPAGGSAEDAPGPDIYVVLLDGYPRADVLEHVFDHENELFLSELEERGFWVAPDSHSDYLWTHVSLSSMLHMEYIEDIESLASAVEGIAPQHPAIRRAINRNPAFEFLRERGYRVMAVPSGYEELAPRGADEYVDNGSINEFEVKLLSSTFLGNAVAAVAPDFASSSHRDRISDGLASLRTVAETEGTAPRLVFAHIPAPHQPTVFGREGRPIAVPLTEHFYSDSPIERGIGTAAWKAGYRDQLEYLNELILDAVTGILEASDEPPVIILWSDHGSASRVDWVQTQPTEANPVDLLERTGTLFAALTPNREEVFPDDITPVNTFRFLFDAYFGTTLGPAEPPPGGGQIPPVDASVLDE